MTGFIRSPYVHIGATASAVVVALGLVTVPPERYDSVIVRTEFAAVQLQAAVSTQISAVVNFAPYAAATAAVDSTAPAASASSGAETLTQIVTAALAVAAVPLWYLAFPVTLPLSLIGGIGAVAFANGLPAGFGLGGSLNPIAVALFGLTAGLGIFAAGPLGLALGSISALFTPSATSAAATKAMGSAATAQALMTPDAYTVEAQSLNDTSVVSAEIAALENIAPLGAPQATAPSAAAAITANPIADLILFITNVAKTVVNLVFSPILVPLRLYTFAIAFGCFDGGAAACNTYNSLNSLLDIFTPKWPAQDSPAPAITPAVAAARRAATATVAEATTEATMEALATVSSTGGETTKPAASNNRRQRAATQRARAVVLPAATASSMIVASTPEAIDTPTSTAPSTATNSRIARVNKNAANTDSGKTTRQTTPAAP